MKSVYADAPSAGRIRWMQEIRGGGILGWVNCGSIMLAAGLLPLGLFGANYAYASDELWHRLAEGGKVVLMRHASVQRGSGGGNPLLRDPSCARERNLSSEGQAEARMVGERFREHSIPIAEVRHSPFCRTSDTAKIAFGTGAPSDDLALLEVLGPDAAAEQTERLNHIIGSYAGQGNLILVTHEPNINAVSFEVLRHSDFLVLQPMGGDVFDELGVVRRDAPE